MTVALIAPLSGEAADGERAVLGLVLNEVDKGEILVVLTPDDVLARLVDLEQAGLRGLTGKREAVDGEAYVALRSLAPGVTYEVDLAGLVLRLLADPRLLPGTVRDLGQGRPPDIDERRDPSAFLNYAVQVLDFEDYAAFTELGVSVGNGRLLSTAARTPREGLVRGLTSYVLDDRRGLRQWVIGDSFATGGTLGGSLFLGGLGVTREFGLDPYYVAYPTLGLAGAAQTPSTAEVYVNGVLVRRESLPPGPFELQNLPVPTGSGQSRLVLTDAFGRATEVALPFYFTTRLLAPGVHDFGYHLGFRREGVGRTSWDYRDLGALARHRVGLTEDVTAGLRAEGAADLVSGGPSVTARFRYGEVEAAVAGSQDGGRTGMAGALGYSYTSRWFGVGAAVRVMSDDYATLSLGAREDRFRVQSTVSVGFPVGPRASVTLQYRHGELRDKGRQDAVGAVGSIRLTDRMYLTVGASHAEGRPGGSRFDAAAGLVVLFGGTSTASLTHQQSGSAGATVLEVQRPLPTGPAGVGYRVQAATTGTAERVAGALQYQNAHARYEVGAGYDHGAIATTLGVAGGLVVVGGGVYATQPVQNSFAVVRVPDVEGVRVYAANQEIGRTNTRGDLFIPSLVPYYANQIAIAGEDIPIDWTVDRTEQAVAPPSRGGRLVAFPIRRLQAVTGRILLRVGDQVVVPAFGQLRLEAGTGRFESPVGRQGEFYLEDVPAGRQSAVVEHASRTCRFDLEVPEARESVANLGVLYCPLSTEERTR